MVRRFWQSPLPALALPAEPQLEAFIALYNLRALSDGPAEERYQQVTALFRPLPVDSTGVLSSPVIPRTV